MPLRQNTQGFSSIPGPVSRVKISSRRVLEQYLQESRALARWANSGSDEFFESAGILWRNSLLRRGYTAVPPFLVADLLARASSESTSPTVNLAEIPETVRALIWRYNRVVDGLLRLQRFRPVLGLARTRRNFSAVLQEVLEQIAEHVEAKGPLIPAFRLSSLAEAMEEFRTKDARATLAWKFLPLWESFVSSLERAAEDWRRMEDQTQQIVGEYAHPWDVEMMRLLLLSRFEEMPAEWDLEAVGRTLEDLRTPVRWTPEEERLFSLIPDLPSERVQLKSRLPAGGFIGLRPNGGLEDVGSVTPSELAFPWPVFMEKAFHRRLNVFDRPVTFIRGQKWTVCLFFFDSEELNRGTAAGAAYPRAEAVSALVCVVAELARRLQRCSAERYRLHLFGPGGRSLLDPARLLAGRPARPAAISSQPGLPFFLDPARTGSLYRLFLRRLIEQETSAGAPRASPPALFPAAWDEGVLEGGKVMVVRIGGGERGASGRGLARDFLETKEGDLRIPDSLCDARVGPGGWNLSVQEGRRVSEASDLPAADLVRRLVLHVVRKLLRLESL